MFTNIGYFKEYYLNGKYLGNIKTEKDRDIIGYNGKKEEILTQPLILDNKKKIKANISYTTILYPLCGKINEAK